MAFRTVDVYYVNGPRGAKVNVIGGDLELTSPHDIVVWRLHNFAPFVFPEVRFDARERDFLGPFNSLIRGRRALLGIGRPEVATLPSDYRYTLSLQQSPVGGPVQSEEMLISDKRGASLATTLVTVDCRTSDDGKIELIVKPEMAATCAGAPLTWDFGPAIAAVEKQAGSGRAKAYRPKVLFTSASNRGYLGPYSTLMTDGATVSVAERLDHRPNRYFYEVELEEITGHSYRLAADVDPILDDEGDPPESGGE